MQRKTLLLPITCSLLAAACGASLDDTTQSDGTAASLETATHVAALEVNEDGSDLEGADAIEDEAIMIRECGFRPLRRHLVDRFDADGNGELDADEAARLRDEFGGPFDGERPEFARRPDIEMTDGGVPVRPLGERPLPPEGERPDAERPGSADGGRPNAVRPPHPGRQHRLGLLHALYDLDGSRGLDEEERSALEDDLTARCEQRMGRLLAEFDTGGDDELDDDEWAAARAAIATRFAEHRAQVIAEFDADGDGALNEAERGAAHEARIAKREAERAQLEADFDGDGDGALDEEERAAQREAMRARIRGEAMEREVTQN